MSSEVRYENGRLTVTRIFNAPRAAVFDAWIKTSKVELWWGCADAIQVKSTIEPKLGGQFAHLMTLKDVGEYQHYGVITEYEPPALLAYELVDPFSTKTMTVRVEFKENGSRTTVCLTQNNLPDAYSQFVMVGWADGFEKLASFLVKEVTAISAEALC